MRAARPLLASLRGRGLLGYLNASSAVGIGATARGVCSTTPVLRKGASSGGANERDEASQPPPSPSSSAETPTDAKVSVPRGASFAKSLRAGKSAGGAGSVLESPAGVYAHTILTAADKAPTGVAVPAAAATATAGGGASAATGKATATAPPSRKRYATVPLRAAGSERRTDADTPSKATVSYSGLSGGAAGSASTPPQTESPAGSTVAVQKAMPKDVKTAARPQDGPMVPDYGPLRATGLWSVEEVLDETKKTVDFRRIDDVESDIVEELKSPDEALVPYAEEETWKHKLMFECKFKKTPKHLTWKELGEEIECMDCVIDLDEHRPEELFTISFYFTDKKTGTRDVVWSAKNDVSYSEGFTDLLAAVGACLGRSDVHRTIRFDDGVGCTRDVTFRKRSRYTSDVYVAFRPPEKYNKFERKEEVDEYEAAMAKEGMSTWGYHPSLMDPEFSEMDFQDPEGTYEVAISAHGFSFIILRAVNRLLARPMKDFYRPSQLMRTAKVKTEDEIGFVHAMKGWMGVDEQLYMHYTPIEALQDHWLGKDAPFSLCAIVNKIREMNYLKKENPEFQSWLAVRHRDTHLAIRNMGVKLLGVGASTLFVPVQHNATVNRLLPKSQQRRLESKFSLNAVLGLPDETRKLEEFKRITGHDRITGASTTPEKPAEGNAATTQSSASEK